jgi:hypothetical protein
MDGYEYLEFAHATCKCTHTMLVELVFVPASIHGLVGGLVFWGASCNNRNRSRVAISYGRLHELLAPEGNSARHDPTISIDYRDAYVCRISDIYDFSPDALTRFNPVSNSSQQTRTTVQECVDCVEEFHHDGDGNLTNWVNGAQNWVYEWDWADRMTKASSNGVVMLENWH